MDCLQRDANKAYEVALALYEEELAAWTDDRKGQRGGRPEKPELERFYSTDTTIEAIAKILSGSPGVALIRDELVGWVKSFDAYKSGRGGERQNHLGAWSGAPMKVDRKTMETIFIENPVVCVTGGIQPDVLHELAEEAGRRDGFLERYLWEDARAATPARWSEATVSKRAQDGVVECFMKLRYKMPQGVVSLSVDAKSLWVSWYDTNQRATKATEGLTAGVYAKLPNQLARVALILHCVSRPLSTDVDVDTMLGAIVLIEYYRENAHLVLSGLVDVSPMHGAGLAARTLRALQDGGTGGVLRTALYKALGGHTPAGDLDRALDELQQDGLAHCTKSPSSAAGGRPAERWFPATALRGNEGTEETPHRPITAARGSFYDRDRYS